MTDGNYINTSSGVVGDLRTGQQFNLNTVDNANHISRDYKGLSLQFDYRVRKNLSVSGNWNLSWTRGSVEGEDLTSGATRASANEDPEYRQASWNYPVGSTNGDQRHKVRVFGSYELPLAEAAGKLALGFMQRFDSGQGYDNNMAIDSRPYVTNHLYLVPTSGMIHFISDRGAFKNNQQHLAHRSVDVKEPPREGAGTRASLPALRDDHRAQHLAGRGFQHDDSEQEPGLDHGRVQPVYRVAGRRGALEAGAELRPADQPHQLLVAEGLQRFGRCPVLTGRRPSVRPAPPEIRRLC